MSGDNVKSTGPIYLTACAPYPLGYHRTGLIFMPQTREYEWPFRHGRGIGIRLPHLLIARGGDGHLWVRLTSRVRVIGLWRSTKERRAYDEDRGLSWALKAVDVEADGDEISAW